MHSDPVSSTTSDDDENEFYDAQELSEADGMFSLKISPARSINDINGGSSSESEELNSCETEPQFNASLQVGVCNYDYALFAWIVTVSRKENSSEKTFWTLISRVFKTGSIVTSDAFYL